MFLPIRCPITHLVNPVIRSGIQYAQTLQSLFVLYQNLVESFCRMSALTKKRTGSTIKFRFSSSVFLTLFFRQSRPSPSACCVCSSPSKLASSPAQCCRPRVFAEAAVRRRPGDGRRARRHRVRPDRLSSGGEEAAERGIRRSERGQGSEGQAAGDRGGPIAHMRADWRPRTASKYFGATVTVTGYKSRNDTPLSFPKVRVVGGSLRPLGVCSLCTCNRQGLLHCQITDRRCTMTAAESRDLHQAISNRFWNSCPSAYAVSSRDL